MKTSWTAGLEKDAAKVMKGEFLAALHLRRRLSELCDVKIKNSYVLSKDQYDCPNWQYQQADSVGYRRAIEEILSLLED